MHYCAGEFLFPEITYISYRLYINYRIKSNLSVAFVNYKTMSRLQIVLEASYKRLDVQCLSCASCLTKPSY